MCMYSGVSSAYTVRTGSFSTAVDVFVGEFASLSQEETD